MTKAPTAIDPTVVNGIGASPLRKEDWPLVRGEGTFIADFKRPGMAHAFVVRSPLAHASFTTVDCKAALAAPGVLDVITAADLPDRGRPIPTRQFSDEGSNRFLQRPLADGVVRYSGEPVAVVIADTRYRAEDAAELINVDYIPLDVVLDADEAAQPNATLLQPHAGTNVAGHVVVEMGALDEAFSAADLVVSETFSIQRHAAVPLETRGLLAEYDPTTESLTVWGAAKIPHVNRTILTRLLGWSDERRVRLVELHVGGGFGARGEFYPEDYLIPFAAIRVGKPIQWVEDREENLRATNHSREQSHRAEIALRKDGTFMGLRDSLVNNTGAYVRTHGMTVPALSVSMLPGPYRWPSYRGEFRSVVTNKTPGGTYRSPGRFEINFVRERLIDMAAHQLDIDPIELRRRNLIDRASFPHEVGTLYDGHPVIYDSGDYELLLDKALAEFDYEGWKRWRLQPASGGLRRGLGIGYFVEKAGPAEREYARVELNEKGEVIVYTGSVSVGQGVETILAQVCVSHLGLPYENVTVVHGDTAVIPEGMGAFGSRATMLGGAAVMRASAQLKKRILDSAAEELEAAPGDLVLTPAGVSVIGAPSRTVSLSKLLSAQGGVITQEDRFVCDLLGFPYGIHFAAVEVDPASGAIHIHRYAVAYDIGRCINPVLVKGQISGGFAQGVGGAMLEEFSFDMSGQPLAASFMDYLLPTSQEVPDVQMLITEDAPSPLNPLGVKGAGEGGTAAVGAAIANAVSDALGREVTRLPLSPQRVVELAGK
ncbi:MAG: xanthine dehydrogenase family protein molybdopterin-binding subunit [Candidatus Dormibacteraeota bacterium]|nr:xanthine dehydrogenase family protein molybdopterin-binding subunit [Candidatus Dormibacteraeota bacterium]